MTDYLRLLKRAANSQLYERDILTNTYKLRKGEYHPDILDDISTKNGKVSVYKLNKNKSDLNHLISAIAAKSTSLQAKGYIIFDDSILNILETSKPEKSNGDSASPKANNVHYDIIFKSTQEKLLLSHLLVDKGESDSISKMDLKSSLIENITKNKFTGVPDKLLKQLGLSDL